MSNFVQHEINRLKEQHFDTKTNEWKGSPAEQQELKRKVRLLKFSDRITEDLELVNNPDTPLKQRMMLQSLISRRQYQQYWSAINKTNETADGMLFSFKTPEKKIICNCTLDQLTLEIKQVSLQNEEAEEKELISRAVDERRQLHNLSLIANLTDLQEAKLEVKDSTDEIMCPNPIEWIERVSTHTIGNIKCQACISLGLEAQEGKAPVLPSAAPMIDHCPNFLSICRNLDMKEYVEMMSAHVTIEGSLGLEAKRKPLCYAGLLHSEMLISDELSYECCCTSQELLEEYNEDEFLRDSVRKLSTLSCLNDGEIIQQMKSLHQEIAKANAKPYEHCRNRTTIRRVMTIMRKCDTCNYESYNKKEYLSPAPVQDGEELAI